MKNTPTEYLLSYSTYSKILYSLFCLKTIKNNVSLNLAYNHDNTSDCQSSDFILYDGEKENSPVKIEAIAVASGFENADTFSGAKFGAGKGVVWNNYYKN